jgi:hypothetical protein
LRLDRNYMESPNELRLQADRCRALADRFPPEKRQPLFDLALELEQRALAMEGTEADAAGCAPQ